MRTKGLLQVTCGGLVTTATVPIASMRRDTPATRPTERDANARHLAACWNAVEAVGGDPDTVCELVGTLRAFEAWLAFWAEDQYGLDGDPECEVAELPRPRVYLAAARALLARVDGGPAR